MSKQESSFSVSKLFLIIILAGLVFIMLWFASDTSSSLWNYSVWYFGLGLTALSCIAIDAAVHEKHEGEINEMFKTIVYEDSWFTKQSPIIKGLIIAGLIAWGLFIFYQSKGGFETIRGPEYSISGLGDVGNAIVSGIAGTIENYAWFAVIPSLFGFLFYWMFGGHRGKTLAVVMGIIGFFAVGTFAWAGYHWFRYGLSDLTATYSVIEFAIVNLIWVYITKNILLPMSWHFFNNFGYRLRGVNVNYMEGNWLLYIIVFMIAVILFNLYIRRKRK